MSSEKQVRIVIADDHPLVREACKRLLEAGANFKVVGEASDGAEAVKLALELKPDILLLDLAMPKPHPGLDVLRALRALAPPVRVILLTLGAEQSEIVEALRLGARGVLLKQSAAQLLLKAIEAVMAGTVWLGPETLSDLMDYLAMQPAVNEAAKEEARENKLRLLSRRELEIVQYLVQGLTNHEIADRTGLSRHTVKNYLFRIFDKLGVSSRVELLFLALSAGKWSDGPEDADTAGIAVKKPRSPNLNSGSAAANLDDMFDDREGTSYDGAPTIRSRDRGESPPTRAL